MTLSPVYFTPAHAPITGYRLYVHWLQVEAGGRVCTAILGAPTDNMRVLLVRNLNEEVSQLNATGQLSRMAEGFGFRLVGAQTVKCLRRGTEASSHVLVRWNKAEVLARFNFPWTDAYRSVREEQWESKESRPEQKCEWVRKQQKAAAAAVSIASSSTSNSQKPSLDERQRRRQPTLFVQLEVLSKRQFWRCLSLLSTSTQLVAGLSAAS